MKYCSPLIMALVFACTGASHANEWTSLSGIGDKITLKKGETVMIVSVSEETEILYDKPGRTRAWFPLQPENKTIDIAYPHLKARRDTSVSYTNPFVLSGPATITVSHPSVITMKVIRPVQPSVVSARPAATKLAPRPPVRRLPTQATGWASLTK